MSYTTDEIADVKARLEADPDGPNASNDRYHLEMLEGIKADEERVAARQARFIGGGNVIRVTSTKAPTTESVRRLAKGKDTVPATHVAVAVPPGAAAQVVAVHACETDPDRAAVLDDILSNLGPHGVLYEIAVESPIETVYEEGNTSEIVA